MDDAKVINGHIYERRVEGREVYYVDFKQFIDPAEAAKALGVSVNEFLRLTEVEIDGD